MARTPGKPHTNPQTGLTTTWNFLTYNPAGTGDAASWGTATLSDLSALVGEVFGLQVPAATPLGPTTAAFTAGSAPGTLVAPLTGMLPNETIATVSPNDGRIVSASGGLLVSGLTASSAGTTTYTITTSRGRTLVIDVKANATAALNRVAQLTAQVNALPAAPAPQSMWDQQAAEAIDPDTHPHMGTFTHTAKQDGLWSDPATWVGGVVPGSAADTTSPRSTVNVNVSSFKVTFDLFMVIGKALNGIHVGGAGTLLLSRVVETRMYVDTIMVHGITDFGQANSPIPESATPGKAFAEIIYLPQQAPGITTRLGLMCMGPVRFHGSPKTARFNLQDTIAAGATTITVDASTLANSGWRVGDRILLLATEDAGSNATDPQYKGPTTYYGMPAGGDGLPRMQTQVLGFKKSQDEVRSIKAISGNTITLGSAADHTVTQATTFAHRRYIDTLPRGQLVDIKPSVAMLTYSIRMRSADAVTETNDLSVLQNRAHSMFMFSDDIDVRYAEARNMARTDTNPTLTTDQRFVTSLTAPNASRDLDFVLMTAAPGTAGAALVSDPLNVRGRYAWHLHGNGPYISRRNCVLKGVSAWAPTDQVPQPGWAMTQHNSRALFEDCTTYNSRGAGIVSENGNEAGQWINCVSAWNRGDGFKTSWQGRHERIQNHNGSSGIGFESQARQILQQGNIATSSHYGWVFLQQATFALPGEPIYGTTTPSSTTLFKRIPDEFSLRYRDPLADGNDGHSFPDNGVENALTVGTYGIEQSQIPDFNDNQTFGCMTSWFVAHRPSTIRADTTPMVARRNHAINCRNFFHLEEYSFYYSFYDTLCLGLSKTTSLGTPPFNNIEGVNWAISLGTVSWQFNFANFKFKNFAAMVVDNGIGVNYNGFFVDCDASDVTIPFSVAAKRFTTNPATHPFNGVNGPWTWTGPDASDNDSYAAQIGGIGWSLLSSASQLPLDVKGTNYPQGPTGIAAMPTAMRDAYIAAGSPRPFFWGDPASDGATPISGFNTLSLFGYIADSVGLRRWPDHQVVDPAKFDIVRDNRTNVGLDASHLIRRNGCYLDGTVWKMPLWFTEHDRGTGEYIQFRISVTLTLTGVTTIEGLPTADFLAKYTVDPSIKPPAPLVPEDVGAPRALAIPTVAPEIITGNFEFPENTPLALTLQTSGGNQNKLSIDTDTATAGNEDAAKFAISGLTLSFAGNATKDFEVPDDANGDKTYNVRIVATDAYGNTSKKALKGTITDVLENVTVFTDLFESTTDQALSARSGWSLINQGDYLSVSGGNLLLKSGGTAPPTSDPTVYVTPDFGVSDMYVEGTPISAPGQVILAARVVDRYNYIGLYYFAGNSNGLTTPLRVVQRRTDFAEDTLAEYSIAGVPSANLFGKKIRLEIVGNTFKVFVTSGTTTTQLTPSVAGSEIVRPSSLRSNRAGVVQNRSGSSGSGPLADFSAGRLLPSEAAATIIGNTLSDTSPWVDQGVTGGTGTLAVQAPLTTQAVAGGFPEPTMSYQWQVETAASSGSFANVAGTGISTGIERTYVPISADVGKKLRCVVTARNTVAGSPVVVTSTSAATDAVAAKSLSPYSTDFEGADEFLVDKNGWSLPATGGQPRAWKVVGGKVSVVNAAVNQNISINGPDIGQANGFVQAVVSATSSSHFVRMRTGGTNGSWIGFRRNPSTNTVTVFTSASSTPSSLTGFGTTTLTADATALIRLEVVGTQFRLLINGTEALAPTTFPVANFPGFRTGLDAPIVRVTVNNWLDSFACGPLGASFPA